MYKILGINISNVNWETAIEKSLALLRKEGKHLVFTPNSNLSVMAIEDESFMEVLNKASLSIPDGMPLVIISKWLGKPLEMKVSGSTYFVESLRAFAKNGNSVFFFGGKKSVLQKVTSKISAEVNGCNIKGWYSPPMHFEKDPEALKLSLKVLEDNPVDILYVAASGGRGEKFLSEYIDEIPCKVAIQVGAAFDFYSGEAKPMPDFMKKIGLGWLFRLIMNPNRMFRRYFLHDIKIFKYAIQYKLKSK